MAKSLVFGNGRMHVGLDEFGLVSDLYFPYIGLENHLQPRGLHHKIGIFVDGAVSWLDDGSWTFQASYHACTMIGETIATNNVLGVRLELTDTVDRTTNMFVRSIHCINLLGTAREVKLYCHQAFMIADSASSDTALYRPDLPGIVHYKGNRVFATSLCGQDEWFDDFSIGKYDKDVGTSTFHDADDGLLEKNKVENGRVDSVLGLTATLGAYDSTRASYVLMAAQTIFEAEAMFEQFVKNGDMHYLARTAAQWREWTSEARLPSSLPEEYRAAIYESLIVIAAHIDARGAVMASLDSSLRNHPQDDAYNFCWPRDAMYTLWPLLRLGYKEELLRFFDFAVRGLHEDGYLFHKYRSDDSLGSTWLPYVHPDGSVHPPIQADETAAVLFLAGQYYRHMTDQAFITRYYESLVEPMANFLVGYTDDEGLPLPSYDLWEHSYATSTYTTSITYAALLEAVELADAYGRTADGARWRAAAEAMQSASTCLYNETTRYFYKSVLVSGGKKQFDATLDSSSLYGAFMYGLFDIESEQIRSSVETARTVFEKDSLYTRFVGDDYYGGASAPNLWPFVSLWMAEIALERDEVKVAEPIVKAVLKLRSASGMMPEQVDPVTKLSTSLSPLVWSHAELISALIDYSQTTGSAS